MSRVIHSTHRRPFRGALRVAALGHGQLDQKVAPWPGRDVTEILPPCSRMIFCETGKPSPVPREPLVEAKI